jgi:hypothetical protein
MQKFKLLADNPVIIKLQAQVSDINLKEQFKKDTLDRKKEKLEVPVDLEAKPDHIKFAPGTFDEQILRDQLLEDLKRLGIKKTIPIKIGVDVTGKDITVGPEDITNNTSTIKLEQTLKDARERIADFNKDVSSQFNGMIGDMLGSVGVAIGNAFSGQTDVFKGLFDSIFGTLGTA